MKKECPSCGNLIHIRCRGILRNRHQCATCMTKFTGEANLKAMATWGAIAWIASVYVFYTFPYLRKGIPMALAVVIMAALYLFIAIKTGFLKKYKHEK